jgi:hypothetical protein
MSEYWKSTPKYWCKHCQIFIRDTPFDRKQHDASPKHQGSLKRFLRDLHRGHEREDRDKQKAKNEVARLNGEPVTPIYRKNARATPAESQPASGPINRATVEERKKQMEQLAQLGVAVPEEFRADLALPGEWQTTSTTIINDPESENADPETKVIGIRKRKVDEDEAELEDPPRHKGWGRSYREYPGSRTTDDGEVDLDELFNRGKKAAIKHEDGIKFVAQRSAEEDGELPSLEELNPEEDTKPDIREDDSSRKSIDREPPPEEGPVLFKKRKPKSIRQK